MFSIKQSGTQSFCNFFSSLGISGAMLLYCTLFVYYLEVNTFTLHHAYPAGIVTSIVTISFCQPVISTALFLFIDSCEKLLELIERHYRIVIIFKISKVFHKSLSMQNITWFQDKIMILKFSNILIYALFYRSKNDLWLNLLGIQKKTSCWKWRCWTNSLT